MFRIRKRIWSEAARVTVDDAKKRRIDLNLSGYGDYEARVDNVHKFKDNRLSQRPNGDDVRVQWH